MMERTASSIHPPTNNLMGSKFPEKINFSGKILIYFFISSHVGLKLNISICSKSLESHSLYSLKNKI